jgi:hypothetical protein
MHNNISTTNSRTQIRSATEQIKEFGGVDFLNAGLRYIARGWPIFPCDGKKQPLTKHGFKDATTDEKQIRAWAKSFPGGLWAYPPPKAVVILDLDMKHGANGTQEFENLQHCKPDEFEAPRVATATGGMHLYTDAAGQNFKNTRSAIAPGIDTRTSGGYVIIPSGAQAGYRWLSDIDTPLPPVPTWADAALRQNSNFESMVNGQPYQGPSLYGNIMLESACDAIATTPGGKQEVTLNDRSYQIGRYVGGGLLERDPTIGELIKAGLQMVDCDPSWEWTEKEIRDKVTRAVDKGMLKPLDDGTEIDRRTQEILDRLFNDPQYAKEVEDFLEEEDAKRATEQMAGPQQEPPKQEPTKQDPPKQEQRQQSKQEQPRSLTSAPPLVRRMGKGLPPPVAFLVEELFHEVGTGTIVSKYLGGKTFVGMALAACVATGSAFAGRTIRRKGAVLWLAAEGEREVDKRVRAATEALECDPDEQPIYVQTASVPKLLSAGGEQAVMNIVRQAEQMAKAEFGVPLVLVVIDTMIKSAGYRKSENDAVEVNNMIMVMENVSIRTKCFVLALDHMGKNEDLGARGSSDKPSSFDAYIELKSSGGSARTFHAVKVKGEKGDEQIDFEIVGTTLEDGQKTAYVRWGEWNRLSDAAKSLNGNARLLIACLRDVIAREGEMRQLLHSEPAKRVHSKGSSVL